MALQATGFTWKRHVHYLYIHLLLTRLLLIRPVYQDEPSQTSEVIQEEKSEVNLTQIEDQMEEAQADSEDEAPVFLDLTGFNSGKDSEVWPVCHMEWELSVCVCWQGDGAVVLDSALEATVDAQEWRLEVERVLPSLKIHVRQDNRVNMYYYMFNTFKLVFEGLERPL